MPIFKVKIFCTTIGVVHVEADDEDAAATIAQDIPTDCYKEEVDSTDYEAAPVSEEDLRWDPYIITQPDGTGYYLNKKED